MVYVRLPKASTRLAAERNHREVMQRARAFSIFEIQCAIVKNHRQTQDIQDTIQHLEASLVAIKEDIKSMKEAELNVENTNGEEDGEDVTEEGLEKQKLLVKRAILLDRIKHATEQFGEEQVNIGKLIFLKQNLMSFAAITLMLAPFV